TGSGKTTTLYTVLRRLNSPEKKILTIEDPVEYNVPGVVQVQTSEAKGLTFASALRNFLRHDPDIIMVGEIRDSETAVMAVEASLTGHLVLSTVHANDAVRTITRIRDLGVNPKLVASTCLGTMAQRLVRLTCPHCQAAAQADEQLLRLAERYQIDLDPARLVRGTGCEVCNHTGYRGRTVIHELMVMTPELRVLVENQASDSDLERLAREQGMLLLLEDALTKVANGLTTWEEVRRVTLV
ncbi:MAG: Flp pilus assembly complex ATPase component TadA, partial [Candidatus Eremiobacteraeota bacterium]|nr:Flp pilus assembly complex ATPase component TadA [Candidatus Eremiobacteraeota bacterium]